MLTLRDIDSLTPYEQLDKAYQDDLSLAFKALGDNAVILYPDGGLLTYRMFMNHAAPCHDSVPLAVDMFFNAYSVCNRFGVAGVRDSRGNLVGAITNALSLYRHPYENKGYLDLWFLNHYDCIFLHGLNEGSILLLCEALRSWHGRRLVLVGKLWGEIAASLPAIDGVDYFWEENENMAEAHLQQYSSGFHCLHIVEGLPHQENPQRYELGIIYYDEVLSFTYMFAKMKSCGEENPDLHFCVIDLPYDC